MIIKNPKKLFKILLILPFLLSLLSSCAPVLSSYSRNNVNFENYNKISVISFNSNSDKISGHFMADLVTLEFLKKDYNVIERNQLKTIIDEKVLNASGLTDENKSVLKLSGINAIVTGNITASQNKIIPEKENFPVIIECDISISLKMFDSQTGEILWSANGIISERNSDLTIYKLLKILIDDLQNKIPSAKKWHFLFF